MSTTGAASIGPNAGYSTGISGTIGAPAAATFGTGQARTAASGGPTFDGSSGSFPANVTFPLLASNLQKTASGLSAAAADAGATATVVSSSNQKSTLQLSIPSLNISFSGDFNNNLVSNLNQLTGGYSYVAMGTWWQHAIQPSNIGTLESSTAFVFGYETPTAGMPSSGTAAFTGYTNASVYKKSGAEILSATAQGDASFSVNFGTGQVGGNFTKMKTVLNGEAWNDVSAAATIAAGTNRFNGTTAAAATSDVTGMRLSGPATGQINGAFFGPAAENLGAVWSLSNGSESVLGTVAAKK